MELFFFTRNGMELVCILQTSGITVTARRRRIPLLSSGKKQLARTVASTHDSPAAGRRRLCMPILSNWAGEQVAMCP
jgi:hypothetical protein